jgi:hypothetical protein
VRASDRAQFRECSEVVGNPDDARGNGATGTTSLDPRRPRADRWALFLGGRCQSPRCARAPRKLPLQPFDRYDGLWLILKELPAGASAKK